MTTRSMTDIARRLADRHAETMGMRYDPHTRLFCINAGSILITLRRDLGTGRHQVVARNVGGHAVYDRTFDDLNTAILVAHGFARRTELGTS